MLLLLSSIALHDATSLKLFPTGWLFWGGDWNVVRAQEPRGKDIFIKLSCFIPTTLAFVCCVPHHHHRPSSSVKAVTQHSVRARHGTQKQERQPSNIKRTKKLGKGKPLLPNWPMSHDEWLALLLTLTEKERAVLEKSGCDLCRLFVQHQKTKRYLNPDPGG